MKFTFPLLALATSAGVNANIVARVGSRPVNVRKIPWIRPDNVNAVFPPGLQVWVECQVYGEVVDNERHWVAIGGTPGDHAIGGFAHMSFIDFNPSTVPYCKQ